MFHSNSPSNGRLWCWSLGLACLAASGAWGQLASQSDKLTASDGAAYDEFGYSVAIGDGLIAVGARMDDDVQNNTGSVYLYDTASGDQVAKLRSGDPAFDDWFGYSVAVGDGLVVVGCPLDDDPYWSGAAYMFDQFSHAQIDKLVPDDGDWMDQFGTSVAVGGGIIVVGSYADDDNGDESGSVYVFDEASGTQVRKLLAADGAAGDRFGLSVAVAGGTIVVGAPLDDDNGGSSGSAYVFDAVTGAQKFKLVPVDGAVSDEFGTSVAISGDIVVVGAYRADNPGPDSGAVYLYRASTGGQIGKLRAFDGVDNDWFGQSVAISGGMVVAGARFQSGLGHHAGAVYAYDLSTGMLRAKLVASDGAPLDELGNAVAIDGDTVVGAAYHDGDRGEWSGSAYVFDLCGADIDGDGQLNTQDFLLFLNLWASGDSRADWNGDGSINTQDFLAYLNDWAGGC